MKYLSSLFACLAFTLLFSLPVHATDLLLWSRESGKTTSWVVKVNDHGAGEKLRGTYCGRSLYIMPRDKGGLPLVMRVMSLAGQVKLVRPNYSTVCTIKAR